MLSAQRSVLALTFHVLCKLAVFGLEVQFGPFWGSNHVSVPSAQHKFVRDMVKLAFPKIIGVRLVVVIWKSWLIAASFSSCNLSSLFRHFQLDC